LSCRSFTANAVHLQLHALAYNLGNFLRTLAMPEPINNWSLTSLKEKLIKIGAGRAVVGLLGFGTVTAQERDCRFAPTVAFGRWLWAR
jgi:Transposase DDE domain group 1